MVLVGKLVKITGRRLAAGPAWDSQHYRKAAFAGWSESKPNVPVPRITRALSEAKRRSIVQLKLGVAPDVQVDVDIIPLLAINVTGNRGQESSDVSRTARDAKPRAARVLAI